MTRIFIYREGSNWTAIAIEFRKGETTPFATCDLGLFPTEEEAFVARDVYIDTTHGLLGLLSDL